MPRGIHSTPEFRARACRQVLELSRPVREVADEMGVKPDTLRRAAKSSVASKILNFAESRRVGRLVRRRQINDLPSQLATGFLIHVETGQMARCEVELLGEWQDRRCCLTTKVGADGNTIASSEGSLIG